jgi:ribosomal protein S3
MNINLRKLNSIIRAGSKPTINVLQEVSLEQQHYYKNNFRTFFEGCYDIDAKIPISITSFGITDITFHKTDNVIHMVITLTRPGLLIGKAGSVYDAIKTDLNSENQPFTIDIIESKLWS